MVIAAKIAPCHLEAIPRIRGVESEMLTGRVVVAEVGIDAALAIALSVGIERTTRMPILADLTSK